MQISTNAVLETHVALEHVKILMDLITASVHLVMSLIQVGNIVWVSSYMDPSMCTCMHAPVLLLHLASSFILY